MDLDEENLPTKSHQRPRRAKPPKRISMTIDETCDATGLGKTKLYELIKQKKLRTVAIGRRRLVLCSSIEEVLQEG